MNKILKLLIPSSKKLAGYAADGIADIINSQTEREAQIAKIATIADKVTEYQAFATKILTDGRVSDDEKEKIAEMLLPAMEYLRGLI